MNENKRFCTFFDVLTARYVSYNIKVLKGRKFPFIFPE